MAVSRFHLIPFFSFLFPNENIIPLDILRKETSYYVVFYSHELLLVLIISKDKSMRNVR